MVLKEILLMLILLINFFLKLTSSSTPTSTSDLVRLISRAHFVLAVHLPTQSSFVISMA